MRTLKTRTLTLTALLLAASQLACDDAVDADDRERTSAELSLEGGAQLLFLVDEDGEISIFEAGGQPAAGSLLDGLDERGVTPAELWVAVAEGEEVPAFLREHHEATVDRDLELRADARVPSLRSWEYENPTWGGDDGYCRSSFALEFEAYNPVTTAVSVSGYVGQGYPDAIYGYSNGYVKHAWVAVCNDTPMSSASTLSEIAISKWDASSNTWKPMECGEAISSGWCEEIIKQEARALHYWTSTPAGQKLRFEASRVAGPAHVVKLRAGYSGLGVGF